MYNNTLTSKEDIMKNFNGDVSIKFVNKLLHIQCANWDSYIANYEAVKRTRQPTYTPLSD